MRQLVESLRQWPQVLAEKHSSRILEQPSHDCESLQLRWRKPKSRKLKCPRTACRGVAVSACCRVEYDRSSQGVLKHVDGTVNRRLRTLKSRHEILERNRGSPIGEDGVKVKDA